MKVYSSDTFVLPLPEGHRFPMAKYRRLRERVEAELVPLGVDVDIPHAATDDELRRAHDAGWVQRATTGALRDDEVRRIGFPWSPAMIERSRRSAGATIDAARVALSDDAGVAVSLAGGTHHAGRDFGAGYCVFNDAAVAARAMQAEGRARRIVIVDLDVHQGDGTADILGRDPDIFTFSMHGERNFPFRKQRSHLDVGLPDGADDDAYLGALRPALHEAFERARAGLVIYLAGVDPWHGDALGRLRVSSAGLARRDDMVFQAAEHAGLPIAVAMAGGYARDVEDIVALHMQTVTRALALWRVRNARASSII